MTVRVMEKNNMSQLVAALARYHSLIGPVRDDGGVVLYSPVKSPGDIVLDFVNSAVSPKGYFFPATEKMFSFSSAGGNVEITGAEPGGKRVLLGVRPCDLRSLLSLDPVFSGDFPDAYYEEKRNNTTIIALACETPGPRCFCTTFGFSPADGTGADVIITPYSKRYLVEALTGRGEELLGSYTDLMDKEASVTEGQMQQVRDGLMEKVAKLDISGVKQYLDDNFELPHWQEIASRCLNCGICTYVCPTCHCFNIIDLTKGDLEGIRCRGWDSCMFGNFTRMAGGHNPRSGKVERVRNRFMHKLKYHLDRYGLPGCSGCGRCVGACPVNIDIREIIDHLREVGHHGQL